MNKEERLTQKVYSRDARVEWNRLGKDVYHRLEFETTMKFLKRYLPKKGLILDAGAGPGRYTIELAKLGYDVVLLDFVKANLDLAEEKIKKAGVEKKVRAVVHGSIVNLKEFKDNSFDAVICLGGPLSHVCPEKNRKLALKELRRVAKRNAPIFISVMMKYAVLMMAPNYWHQEIKITKHFEELLLKGEDYMWHKRYYCHFFISEELEALLKEAGINFIKKVGLEGISSPYRKAIRKIARDKKLWANWIKAHYYLCEKKEVADTSMHTLFIGRKK
jgi:ubiquinone/menaquinone biosynthesis C-methylase UbiE